MRKLVRYGCFGVLGACWMVFLVQAWSLLVQWNHVNG